MQQCQLPVFEAIPHFHLGYMPLFVNTFTSGSEANAVNGVCSANIGSNR
jgi:hypothetical protein